MKAKFYERLIKQIGLVIDEGIHVVDADGKTIIYTQNMATLEKTNCEEVIGKPFREVFSDIPEIYKKPLHSFKMQGLLYAFRPARSCEQPAKIEKETSPN